MNKLKIKKMKTVDIPSCARVIRKGFYTVANEFHLTIDNCKTNGAFIKSNKLLQEKSKGTEFFYLSYKMKKIGFMGIKQVDSKAYEIQKITILPKYRHNGFGAILLNYAIEYAENRNAEFINVNIINENLKLKQWYLNNGFKFLYTEKFDTLPFIVGYMSYKNRKRQLTLVVFFIV